MKAPFNSLKRGERYTFVESHGGTFQAVFHGILPDGLLQVGIEGGVTGHLNPALIVAALSVPR